MKTPFAAGVLLLTLSVAGADDAAAKKLLKELEGSYTPTAITKGGEVGAAEEIKAVSAITIKGDMLTVRFKKADSEVDHSAILVVQPDQKPVAIDMTPKDGPDAGKPVLGIIKVEKDTVTLCWSDRGGKAERPTEFTSTKENKQFLIVLKKMK